MDQENLDQTGKTPDIQGQEPVAPERKESAGGKRLAPSNKKKRKAAAAGCVLAALLLAAYLGICAYANTGEGPLPNTKAAGVDLSGVSWNQAEQRLEEGLRTRLSNMAVQFVCEGQVYTVPGETFTVHTAEAVEHLKRKQSGSFLLRGGQLIGSLLGGGSEKVSITLGTVPEAVLKAMEDWCDSDAQTTYTLTDTEIVFTKGRTGRSLDVAALLTALEEEADRMLNGEGGSGAPVETQVTTMPPAEPNLEAIREEIYAVVSDAYYDPEAGEIVPSVTGRDLDVEGVRRSLSETGEGADCRVPLILTQPEVTTETLTELLFRDVLGETTTYAYGNTGRRTNVRLSAEFANGRVLMPGDEFSYANDCGPFTTDRGFMAAPGYLNGKTVDMEGGGVCQTASTIYLAVLYAGLEVTERHPHGYEPAYVPAGLDATVAGTVLDFRFKNNTEYPVRIETEMDAKYNLTVKIMGTNLDGTYWKPYTTNRVVTKYAETVYEPKEDVPQGTLVKDPERTAYNAISVDTYTKQYDAEGNVLQEVYLYRTKYKGRDAVMWYNPADAALWGIDPETGTQVFEPIDPNATPDPGVTPDPGTQETPAVPESAPPEETGNGDAPLLPPTTPEPTPEPTLPPEPTPALPSTDPVPAPTPEPTVPGELPSTGEESQTPPQEG